MTNTNCGSNSGHRNNKFNKDSTNCIKIKLSFHDITEFTRRVDIRPFADKMQLQRTILR
jgi:hypothetical protein